MLITSYDAKNKIWSGPKVNPIYNPKQNLGNLLLTALHQRSTEIAQISADTGVALTCRQFRERTITMAAYLKSCGLREDQFVGFIGWNTENLLPCVYACFAMGIPICPLSPIMTTSDIVKIYSIVKPALIFCDKKNLATVQEAVLDMKYGAKILTIMDKVVSYDCATEIMRNGDHSIFDEFVAPDINPDKILAVICSSGSTGTPKRIIRTHLEVITHFNTGWHLNRIHPAICFNSSALFWISGFNSSIYTILNHSTNVITSELSLQAEQFVDILRKYNVTHVVTLPFTISYILEVEKLKPFEYIESWMISGFAATQTLCERFMAYLPHGRIWITYGLTEKYIVSCNSSDQYDHVGFLNNNIQVKLVDTNGNKVGPNQHGEICIRDNPPFGGYHGDPAKTAEAVKDGWFYTSDIGYFDSSNRLHYVDRKVEIMNFEEYYIIPHEIESIINEVDGVVESSIVGVLEKESINYIIHAFVVTDKLKDVKEKDILEHVHSKVIEQRKLRGGVHFVDKFPLGKTGKVDKMKLRELAIKHEYPENEFF